MGRRMGIEHAEITKAPKDPVLHVPRTAVSAMAGGWRRENNFIGRGIVSHHQEQDYSSPKLVKTVDL